MEQKRILAVVVTYYPERELLERNIHAFIDHVDKVLIWENTPEADRLQYRYIENEKVEYHGAGVNSISRALNFAWYYARKHDYAYLLTMDQDSVFEDFAYYVGRTIDCAEAPEGIWTPQINQQDTNGDYEEINMPITSGMLSPLKFITEIGGWNEFFTIDSVDDEFFLKAHLQGVKKYRVKGVNLIQRYGTPNTVRWLGHELVLRNDGPERLKSIYKNKVMLIKTNPKVSYLREEFFHYWPKVIILTLFFEQNKFRKIWAIFCGLWSGLTGKISELRRVDLLDRKKVLVLMSTYNGEAFLSEQIDSILAQESVEVDLLVRDDGSSDHTRDILATYAAKTPHVRWYSGENLGFVRSFTALVDMAYREYSAYDYYAFSDQDDVWHKDKLQMACGMLLAHPQDRPLLFTSNSMYVDDNLNELNLFHREQPYFTRQNIMIYPVAQGCSMVFNRQAMALYLAHPPVISWHDRWMSLVCNFFGDIVYSYHPLFCYRIHDNNVQGKKQSFYARIVEDFRFFFSSDPKNFPMIEEFYQAFEPQLTDEDRKTLLTYLQYKHSFRKKLVLITSVKYLHTRNVWDILRKSVLFLFNRM